MSMKQHMAPTSQTSLCAAPLALDAQNPDVHISTFCPSRSRSPMRCLTSYLTGILLLVAAVLPLTAEDRPQSPDPKVIRSHAEALAQFGDRSPGSEGALQAATYIEEILGGLTQEVWTQRTSIVVPVDLDSHLQIGGTSIALTPHAPNGSVGAGTGGETIRGRLRFIDQRDMKSLQGDSLRDTIVVLNGDSAGLWRRCAQFGAIAVIFRNPETIDNLNLREQHLSASIAFPRFIADLDDSLDGQEAELTSTVVYRTVQAPTIVARIRGTSEDAERRETVLLASGYESEGAIRGHSPGATRAWNAALLLSLAEQFRAAPLNRDLIVVFHGARPEFFRGMRQFLAGITDADQRMVLNDVGQRVPMGDSLLQQLELHLWRSEEIEEDFREFLIRYPSLELDIAEIELRRLLRQIRNPPTALLAVTQSEEGEAVEASAPLFSTLQWIMIAAMSLGVALILTQLKPDGRGTAATFLSFFLLLGWIIAERPQSTAVLKEAELRAESDRLEQLGYRFISEEAAGFADAIRPRLRATALRASRGARDGLTPEEIKEARALQQKLDVEHRLWRDIQQKIGRRALESGRGDTPEEIQQLPLLIGRILGIDRDIDGATDQGQHIGRHQAILRNRIADLRSTIAIREQLNQPRVIHMVALDFSDGNTWWSSAISGPWMRWADRMRSFTHGVMTAAREINESRVEGPFIQYDSEPNDLPDVPDAFWPTGYLHDAGVASAFVNSVTFSTVNDRRLRLGSPADTMPRFNTERFLRQTEGLTAVIRQYLNSQIINSRHAYREAAWRTPTIRNEISSEGSTTGRKSYSYPLVQLQMGRPEMSYFGDVRHVETWWGNALGDVTVPWMPERMPRAFGTVTIRSVGFDDAGNITQMNASRGTQMRGGSAAAWNLGQRFQDLKPVLFDSVSSWLMGIHDPRLLMDLSVVNALSASRDALPDFAHVEVDRGAAAIFVPADTGLRILASEGQIGNRMALVGPPTNQDLTDFAGLPGEGKLVGLTAVEAAQDFFNLNEGRLAILRRNGVNPESLLFLHSESERFLEEAREHIANGDYVAAEGAGQAAWSMAGRVYPAVLSTANDVVYGLVVMLLFAIPFAAICERLFYAGNTIYKKVAGFFVFFSLTFLFFFFFHPAFALATTPVIIFLAFAIIVMSALVIVIIFNRFEHEMELIRMAGLGMHKVDVSRLGTLLATVTLGISNMRRRPLRTFLTAITVVLMSFILLTFASFNATSSTRRVTADVPPTFQGIMLRQNGWLPISERGFERLDNTWGRDFHLFERRWLDAESSGARYTFSGDNGVSFVEAVVGARPKDPSGIENALLRPDRDEAGFGDNPEEWIFLPPGILYEAGVTPGNTVQFMGLSLRVGTIDTTVLGAITHMDGDPITPLAPSPQTDEQRNEAQRMQDEAATGEVAMESGSFIHLGPNVVGITYVDNVKKLGGHVRSVAMTARTQDLSITAAAEDMAQQLAMSLRVGRGTETLIMTAVGRLSVAGLSDVLIPLILGGMIIFSTMLGSVAERGKEIFIYASLGLAPLHIGALFLVEASIYAILGGLGGYILAQFVVTALGVAADLGFGVQPDLNYSSFTAVITILLVMATVLISALYPALVASKAANPGTDNSFRVPEPKGDDLEIPFPFTVARRDIMGLLAYLTSYLDAHTEASTGCFTAAEATMNSDWEGYSVTAKTWLAPFDLGISQQFTISAKPTDVKAIYSIHISMHLLSGQRSAWRRVTVPFLKELRQQFLVWRTLDEETTDRYRAAGGDVEAQARMEERKRKEAERAAAAAQQKDQIKAALTQKNSGEDMESTDDADEATGGEDRR
ncbi:MAG: ABC transporter permease [Planctomycetota bacterium]|nr:MAG: ABC transporter permease [Planctomycetota bacterium]